MKTDEPWYAVKCVFSHSDSPTENGANLYEERITLWRADSWEQAFAKAKEEATKYSEETGCELNAVSDAFHLFCAQLGEGAEVWSAMRESHLDPKLYRETFCATPRDRIGDEPGAQQPPSTDGRLT